MQNQKRNSSYNLKICFSLFNNPQWVDKPEKKTFNQPHIYVRIVLIILTWK